MATEKSSLIAGLTASLIDRGSLFQRRWRSLTKSRPKATRLSARDAYRQWAPTYAAETATSYLDEMLAQEMLRGLPQARLLDAGCGVGRRIAGIPNAIGVDPSPEMLDAGGNPNVLVGDVRALPFDAEHFDMIWCRLVLGHLPELVLAYQEMFRVCQAGGYVFVTDFHPDAVLRGHKRTFTDAAGVMHEIEHYIHQDHAEFAVAAGFHLCGTESGAVGPWIRHFYEEGIGLKSYRRDRDLKLVSAYLFQKPEQP